MRKRKVYKDKYYCYRCGILVKRPKTNRAKICDRCIVERYKIERKEYWKKYHGK